MLFFFVKFFGCYGDGGVVFIEDVEFVKFIDFYCVYGKGLYKYDNECIGMNS